jgi:hypothetical protein
MGYSFPTLVVPNSSRRLGRQRASDLVAIPTYNTVVKRHISVAQRTYLGFTKNRRKKKNFSQPETKEILTSVGSSNHRWKLRDVGKKAYTRPTSPPSPTKYRAPSPASLAPPHLLDLHVRCHRPSLAAPPSDAVPSRSPPADVRRHRSSSARPGPPLPQPSRCPDRLLHRPSRHLPRRH